MHRWLLLLTACALACRSPLPSLDDEAGTTTSESESTTEADEGEVTTDDGSTTDGETSSDGPIFIPDAPPIIEPCDMFMQDCPEGEKCVPWSSDGGDDLDSSKCVPVLGDQQHGAPCTYDGVVEATDDCDETSICWNVVEIDGELVGTCAAFCTGTADEPECPEGSVCNICDDGCINVCLAQCDPLAQDCGPALGCYWTVSSFNCIFTTQNIPTGDPCGYINDCAPGNFCVDAAVLPDCLGAACCANFCDLDLGDVECSEPGTVCVTFFEIGMAPPGYENVGLCVLPP